MTEPDCVFCRIASGVIPAPKIYEDEEIFCIRDIKPQASQHILVIPKKHCRSLESCVPENAAAETHLMGRLMEVAVRVARQEGLLPAGFRTIINTNAGAGQTVFHLHLHVLGGQTLSERMA